MCLKVQEYRIFELRAHCHIGSGNKIQLNREWNIPSNELEQTNMSVIFGHTNIGDQIKCPVQLHSSAAGWFNKTEHEQSS